MTLCRISFSVAYAAAILATSHTASAEPASRHGHVVALTQAQSGQRFSLHPGDTITVTLSDPGDGGYTLSAVQSPMPGALTLVSTGNDRHPGAAPGDFGDDVFTFTYPDNRRKHHGAITDTLSFIAKRHWEHTGNTVASYTIVISS